MHNQDAKSDKEQKVATAKQEEIRVERKIKPPDGIALCISSIPGAKFGACSLKDIPVGTWFGPYEGKLVRRSEDICAARSESMWEVSGSEIKKLNLSAHQTRPVFRRASDYVGNTKLC